MADTAVTHEFEPERWADGTRAYIRNQTMGGRPFIEGIAVVRGHVEDETYEVEFEAEPGATYHRHIDGGDVIAPATTVARSN